MLETFIYPPWHFPKRKFGAKSPNVEERKSREEDDDASLANSVEALSAKSPIPQAFEAAVEIGNIAPKVAEPPSDRGRFKCDAFAKGATKVSGALLKKFATAKAPFPKMPDMFKPLAEAFDVATPADVEEEENKFESTVTLPGTIRVKADYLKQDIVISIAFEPKEIDIVDYNHDLPSVGLNVLDISAVEHECEHDASRGELVVGRRLREAGGEADLPVRDIPRLAPVVGAAGGQGAGQVRKVRCANCGKEGYTAADCRGPKRERSERV